MVPRIVLTNGYPDAEAHAAWLMKELLLARRESKSVDPYWGSPTKRANWAARATELECELRMMDILVPSDVA